MDEPEPDDRIQCPAIGIFCFSSRVCYNEVICWIRVSCYIKEIYDGKEVLYPDLWLPNE